MRRNVSELIRDDHREFERLFDQLRDPDKRPLQAPMLVALLAAHARAEEAHVYPSLRELTDSGDEVEHSQEEHVEADALAERLVDLDLSDPEFDKILDQLVAAVRHHLEEEEESVLPALDDIPDDHQEALARGFLATRLHHLCFGTIDLTKSELQTQAANEGVAGTSSMTKDELKREVRAQASS
jgi:hemerythrin superfamily protein